MGRLDREARTNRPPQKNEAPQRELRAKVWESKEPDIPDFSEEDTISPDDSSVFPEDSLEDLPTRQMEASFPEPPIQKPAGTAPASSTWDSNLDDVTQRPTSHLVSQRQVKPEEPANHALFVFDGSPGRRGARGVVCR